MMNSRLGILVLGGILSISSVFAQEPKHDEHKEAKPEPTKKASPGKADAMKCCEGMDKMGEMKDDKKAKTEKMRAMKEKMAEKMKAKKAEITKTKELKSDEVEKEATKDAHDH
jgi:hypothetical protein